MKSASESPFCPIVKTRDTAVTNPERPSDRTCLMPAIVAFIIGFVSIVISIIFKLHNIGPRLFRKTNRLGREEWKASNSRP